MYDRKAADRRYRAKHRQRVLAAKRNSAKKRYHEDPEHRQKVIDRAKAYTRTQLDTNPLFKLSHNLRGRFKQALKAGHKTGSRLLH